MKKFTITISGNDIFEATFFTKQNTFEDAVAYAQQQLIPHLQNQTIEALRITFIHEQDED